jgi:hypothetical protein
LGLKFCNLYGSRKWKPWIAAALVATAIGKTILRRFVDRSLPWFVSIVRHGSMGQLSWQHQYFVFYFTSLQERSVGASLIGQWPAFAA